MSVLTDDEFETAIADALDTIPDEFIEEMDNLAVVAQDEPTQDDLAELEASEGKAGIKHGNEILGLFTGVPLTERSFDLCEGETPDLIQIFKGPHERCFPTHDEAIAQIHKTVIHEVGHFFGWDDDHMHALGY